MAQKKSLRTMEESDIEHRSADVGEPHVPLLRHHFLPFVNVADGNSLVGAFAVLDQALAECPSERDIRDVGSSPARADVLHRRANAARRRRNSV